MLQPCKTDVSILLQLQNHRNIDPKSGAFAHYRLHSDGAAKAKSVGTAYRKTKTGTLHEIIEFDKAVEDAIVCLLGYALAGVGHTDSHMTIIPFLHIDRYMAFGGELEGIRHIVGHNLAQTAEVGMQVEC